MQDNKKVKDLVQIEDEQIKDYEKPLFVLNKEEDYVQRTVIEWEVSILQGIVDDLERMIQKEQDVVIEINHRLEQYGYLTYDEELRMSKASFLINEFNINKNATLKCIRNLQGGK